MLSGTGGDEEDGLESCWACECAHASLTGLGDDAATGQLRHLLSCLSARTGCDSRQVSRIRISAQKDSRCSYLANMAPPGKQGRPCVWPGHIQTLGVQLVQEEGHCNVSAKASFEFLII